MSSFWMIFSFLIRHWYSQMTVFFAVQNLFSFLRSLDCLYLWLLVLVPMLLHRVQKSFPVLRCSSLCPTSSSVRFRAPGLMLELSFVQSDRDGPFFILVHAAIQFDDQHLLGMLSFLQCVFFASSSKIRCP